MRLFINSTIAIYIIGGFLFFILPVGTFPAFYKPALMGSLAFISAFIILLPRIIFARHGVGERARTLVRMEFLIAVILLINGLGGLGLYKLYLVGFSYDKLTHFIGPLLLTLGGSAFISVWFKKDKKAALKITSVLVLIGGIIWEILEATSDKLLGTTLLGGGDNLIALDTSGDIFMNILGITLAIFMITLKREKNVKE